MLDFDAFVLCASTGDLADAETETAREHADAVEFRLDLADDPLAALDDYPSDGLPLLVTYRPEWEGGAFAGAEASRLDGLVAAADHDAVGAVDLELETLRTEQGVETADAVRERGAAVVASVHDFEGTPASSALRRLLHEAASLGDVGKVAVTAETGADALRLLEATHAATAWGDPVATMAMGAAGSHTRAVAPVYGSKVGYAPLTPAQATAPGQYDLATLRALVDGLVGH
ncbi:type I 3-dehydroquinate dehydratase [Salinigranum halophilum]|jgi:3-dehydroquinate dehydratase-1|uniref:type I 3-dehydroquinate dehydratase n=1 Tax=Salinigranum halophilum TaxID=2565931 RepID=UPI0010A8C5C5|nr:type I 3-dehydroquinate dehydratase [Salinigranum halophilum]